jgi:hypothetical protein
MMSLTIEKISKEPSMSIQQHPDYHQGFFDALDDTPIHDDCTPEYRAGWEAAMRSKEIFRNAGFEDKGREFAAAGSVTNGHQGGGA